MEVTFSPSLNITVTFSNPSGGGGSFTCSELDSCQNFLDVKQLAEDAYPSSNPNNYIDLSEAASSAPVQSVNGQIGNVSLDASNIAETPTRFWLTDVLKSLYDGAVTWIATNGTNLINHLSNISNPHNTTASQVGADPIGTATASMTSHLAAADPHTQYLLKTNFIQSHKAVFCTSTGGSHTGDTNITILASKEISGGEFIANDIMKASASFIKTGTAGTPSIFVYYNTSNSLIGATLIGGQSGVAANVWVPITRDIAVKSNTVQRGLNSGNVSTPNDYAAISNAATSLGINLANNWWIIFAGRVNNSADTIELDRAELTRVRQA